MWVDRYHSLTLDQFIKNKVTRVLCSIFKIGGTCTLWLSSICSKLWCHLLTPSLTFYIRCFMMSSQCTRDSSGFFSRPRVHNTLSDCFCHMYLLTRHMLLVLVHSSLRYFGYMPVEEIVEAGWGRVFFWLKLIVPGENNRGGGFGGFERTPLASKTTHSMCLSGLL